MRAMAPEFTTCVSDYIIISVMKQHLDAASEKVAEFVLYFASLASIKLHESGEPIASKI
jgi:hypothetical protein